MRFPKKLIKILIGFNYVNDEWVGYLVKLSEVFAVLNTLLEGYNEKRVRNNEWEKLTLITSMT